jgi:hypothetical protein
MRAPLPHPPLLWKDDRDPKPPRLVELELEALRVEVVPIARGLRAALEPD